MSFNECLHNMCLCLTCNITFSEYFPLCLDWKSATFNFLMKFKMQVFLSYFSSLFNESTIVDKFPLSASIYSNPSTFHHELLIPRQPFGILSTFDMLIKTRADIYYNVKFKPLYIIINPNPAYLKTVHIFVDTCIIFITMLKF